MPSYQLATVAILIAVFGLVECQIYTQDTANLNSTHPFHAASFGIVYPTNTSVSNPQTRFASVYFNVSDATFVDISAFFLVIDAVIYKVTNSSFTSATPGSITGSIGYIVPPCFPANRSESYFLSNEFNATTDAAYGEATYNVGQVGIPTITNSSSFEVKCRVPALGKCMDYYSLPISPNPTGSALYMLSVESTANLTLHFNQKTNNTECAGLPITISANKREDIGLPAVDTPLDFWLGVQIADESTSAQVKMWWVLYATDSPSGNTPSGQTPDTNNSPSSNIVDELPRWALILLIIFGIVLVVLTIVVIALCVQRRNRRVQYSTM